MKYLEGDSYGGMIKLISSLQDSNNELARQNAQEANRFSLTSQLQAQDYNAKEAAKNRDFQLYMSDTAHRREVADLKAAGLNPVLSANNGAAVSSGSAASSGSVQGQQAALDMQAASLYSQLYMNKINNANQLKITKMNNDNAKELAQISAAASMYGANASAAAARFGALQAAAASMYGSDQAYNASIYGADKSWDIANLNSDTSKYNTQTTNFQNWLNNYNRNKGSLWWNLNNGLSRKLGLHSKGSSRSIPQNN